MEIFSIQTGNIKEDGRWWPGMVCGIADFEKSDFLDDISCYIGEAFECSIDSGAGGLRDWGDIESDKQYAWVDKIRASGGCKFVECKNCDLLLVRNEYFFTSKSGWCVLDWEVLREKLLYGLNDFVWRNGKPDDKEKKLCAWLLKKILNVEVAWKE